MKMPQKPKNWKTTLNQNKDLSFELLDNKEIFAMIRKFNEDYLHWDKLRYQKIPENYSSSIIWALMKLFRSQRYELINFDFIEMYYTLLPSFLKKLHELDKYSSGHIQLLENPVINKNSQKYVISSLMEEAIASSQLEGATTTRRVAKEILRQNRKPKTYSEQMILNGYKTMKMLTEKKEKKLTKEFLLDIQKSITKNTLKNKKDEGKFRDNNEIVVGDPINVEKIYHIPPDYNEIEKFIEELCKFANTDDGSKFMHPIIKGIILHFLVGFIHPFNDGNGRTARAIFYWYVLSKDYWLFEYIAISRRILQSKVSYGLAYLYTETDENDLTYFIQYNIDTICKALDDTITYIQKKQQEQNETSKILAKIKGINFRQASILKEFVESPDKIFTITEIKETYRVVYQTARSDLLHIARLGFITKGNARNKLIFSFNQENQTKLSKEISNKK